MKLFTSVIVTIILSTTSCFAAPRGSGSTIKDGSEVLMNYTLSVDDQVLDSTFEREPLTFVQGQNQILPGLSAKINGLKAGNKKSITLSPEEAYGPVRQEAILELPRAQFPPEMNIVPGMVLQSGGQEGPRRLIRVLDVNDNTVVVDMNHPLAGKTLKFDVEVISVK